MSDALDPAKRNSPLANSSHRAIRWRRPSGHANHPKLQELTISRLLDAVEKVTSHRTAIQSCPLWNDLGNRINVFDPPAPSPDEPAAPAPGEDPPGKKARKKGTARGRKRALRRDGGINLITVLCVLIWNADYSKATSNGYIGLPLDRGSNSWEPHTWKRLFEFGFGQTIPGELSLARMERWTRALAEAGLIKTYRRKHMYEPGSFQELPAVKLLTPEIFKLCGTFGVYKAMRREQRKDQESERSKKRLESMGKLVDLDKHKKKVAKDLPEGVQAELIQRKQDTSSWPPPTEGVHDAGSAMAHLSKFFGNKVATDPNPTE